MSVDLGPVIPRRRLGAELKRLRTERDKKLSEVARELLISTSKLSRLETGQGLPSERDMRDLLSYYQQDATELGRQLRTWAQNARKEPWWQQVGTVDPTTDYYIALETAATEIQGYVANFVPSLLQTEEYARALISATQPDIGPALEQQVHVRLRRQDVLSRQNNPVTIDMIIDESVFHRRAGSRKVMREQLIHMANATRQPNVILRVFPFSSGPHAAMSEGTFSLFHYSRSIDPDVVVVDSLENDQHIDQPDIVEKYRDALADLRKQSKTPHESTELIRSMSDTYLGS